MAVMPLPIPSCVYFLLLRMLFIVQPIRKAQVPSFLTEHGESFSVCCTDLHFQDFFIKIHGPVKVFHNKIDRTGSRFISSVLQKSNAKRVFLFSAAAQFALAALGFHRADLIGAQLHHLGARHGQQHRLADRLGDGIEDHILPIQLSIDQFYETQLGRVDRVRERQRVRQAGNRKEAPQNVASGE